MKHWALFYAPHNYISSTQICHNNKHAKLESLNLLYLDHSFELSYEYAFYLTRSLTFPNALKWSFLGQSSSFTINKIFRGICLQKLLQDIKEMYYLISKHSCFCLIICQSKTEVQITFSALGYVKQNSFTEFFYRPIGKITFLLNKYWRNDERVLFELVPAKKA